MLGDMLKTRVDEKDMQKKHRPMPSQNTIQW